MKEKGVELTVVLYNTLLAMCADLGYVDEAIEIVEDMKKSWTCKPDSYEPNIFVLTSLIQCYGKAQRTDDVVRTFHRLLELGITPDELFCYCLLNVMTQTPKEELRRCWKKLVNLDTLYAYCGGRVPTKETRQLDPFSRIPMELSKNNQAAKNKEKEIRKATTAMQTQGGGSSTQATHASKKRRYTFDVQSSGKGTGGSNTRPKVREGAAGPPRHGVGKGLMTFQGPIVPPPLPLLVKDKEYAIDTAHSIVRDADLDECSEHETDPLGDSGLHDMMREVVDLKAKLSGMTHKVDELAKENSLLKSEVVALHEHMGKVKEEAIKEYQGTQPSFNDI
ncbi:hypothetical protein CMV_012051 [Castanea mollissima]|uniref:Pentatricopeptide repeat-containing protein n=1 Tax=Castanea mollissima TaxID=60419 RepID=A0A8J4RJD0_9ROSI|nr:hypothetical protein CMV_012051 [Castanea mollissima]